MSDKILIRNSLRVGFAGAYAQRQSDRVEVSCCTGLSGDDSCGRYFQIYIDGEPVGDKIINDGEPIKNGIKMFQFCGYEFDHLEFVDTVLVPYE